ncbi:hypothetical protein JH26_23935 [Microvirga sp. BSC39]|nr:hypothetical protein JH26_23935 [Microvirga sp. BSC39]
MGHLMRQAREFDNQSRCDGADMRASDNGTDCWDSQQFKIALGIDALRASGSLAPLAPCARQVLHLNSFAPPERASCGAFL